MIDKALIAKYRNELDRFCLMDDTFMNKVFEDKKCAELLIKVILNKDLEVISTQTQYSLKNLQGRSAVLDIFAEDKEGNLYNIEVQNGNEGATPLRARYNSSLIDANTLAKNTSWDTLPETYVIFITRSDILGGNKPLYHIHRFIEELDYRYFGDKTHILYVNSKIRDNTPLGKLMQDFYCTNPEKIHYEELAERVSYFKSDGEGGEIMCQIMDELIQEVNAKAAEEKERAVREATEKATMEATVKTAKETLIGCIKTLMTNLHCTANQAMKNLNIPESDYAMYMEMLNLK